MNPSAGAYLSNGTAVVTATPAPGWTFLHWLGDAVGTNPVTSVAMNRNKCVQAVFGTALSNTIVGSGSVIRGPVSGLYPYGANVRLTAVPQAGNYFALWGNAASGTNNPAIFTVTNANPTVAAVFASLSGGTFALTVVPDGLGEVSASPRANRYGNGTNVLLTASPGAGQTFLGWSGNASGAQNPLPVLMNSSKIINASFSKRPLLMLPSCSEPSIVDGFQFRLIGEFGALYQVQKNDEWQGWTPLGVVTNVFGATQFTDPTATNRTWRAYRVLDLP